MAGAFTAWRSRTAGWRPHATPRRFGIGSRRPRRVARRAPSAIQPIEISSRQARRAARRAAWHDGDLFLDITVMLSVVVFLVLATGVGILALQSSLH